MVNKSLCLGLGALVVMGWLGSARAEHIGIVATVNDDIITSTDLAERRGLIMAASDIPDTPENEQRLNPRILQTLIDETLQLQEAKRQSITVSDADVAKTLDGMAETKNGAPGTLKKAIEAKGLSMRSLQNQIRAQVAWNRVVQRKLRRNVNISKDELARAQQAQASDPGTSEDRISALLVPITSPDKIPHVQTIVGQIADQIKKGQDITLIAPAYAAKEGVQLAPPTWVNEDTLPADAAQVLSALKPGETSAPVRSGNVVQFIKLLERRVTKKAPPSTEVMIKQITLDVPPKASKAATDKLADSEQILRQNPGSCEDASVPATPIPTEVKFARVTLGSMSAEQRNIVARLEVGSLSEPLLSPTKLRLVLLCERMEPTGGSTAEIETLRQQLFAEKMELEAQKHLRNLRRDASIDIRDSK